MLFVYAFSKVSGGGIIVINKRTRLAFRKKEGRWSGKGEKRNIFPLPNVTTVTFSNCSLWEAGFATEIGGKWTWTY